MKIVGKVLISKSGALKKQSKYDSHHHYNYFQQLSKKVEYRKTFPISLLKTPSRKNTFCCLLKFLIVISSNSLKRIASIPLPLSFFISSSSRKRDAFLSKLSNSKTWKPCRLPKWAMLTGVTQVWLNKL